MGNYGGVGLGNYGGVNTQGLADTLAPERLAKLRLIIERAAKTRLERLILEGQYQRTADVQAGRVQRCHYLRRSLLELPRQLAGRVSPNVAIS